MLDVGCGAGAADPRASATRARGRERRGGRRRPSRSPPACRGAASPGPTCASPRGRGAPVRRRRVRRRRSPSSSLNFVADPARGRRRDAAGHAGPAGPSPRVGVGLRRGHDADPRVLGRGDRARPRARDRRSTRGRGCRTATRAASRALCRGAPGSRRSAPGRSSASADYASLDDLWRPIALRRRADRGLRDRAARRTVARPLRDALGGTLGQGEAPSTPGRARVRWAARAKPPTLRRPMSTLQERTRFEPAEVEPRISERWLASGLHHPEPGGHAGGELLDRGPAAERHRRAAHGPRAQRLGPGHAHPLPPHAGHADEVDPRHRPRRHRDPEAGREAARGRGRPAARRSGARRSSSASGRGARSTAADHRAVQAPRRDARLRRRALHARRALRARGARGLRRALRARA